jgi:hypothetical protein
MRFVREAQVMHQELDGGARDRNGTFESVDWLAVYHPESVKGQMLSWERGHSHSAFVICKRVSRSHLLAGPCCGNRTQLSTRVRSYL